MLEPVRAEFVQGLLARMAERRVPQIMRQTDGLGQVFIEPQCPGDGAGDLRNFQRMGQPGAVQIAFRRKEHLCLLLEPTERLAV